MNSEAHELRTCSFQVALLAIKLLEDGLLLKSVANVRVVRTKVPRILNRRVKKVGTSETGTGQMIIAILFVCVTVNFNNGNTDLLSDVETGLVR